MADHLGLNVCPTCSKSYKRPEHLRRHQLSHGSERPYVCVLCQSTFQRSDVLKRHLKTCDNIADASSESLEPQPKRLALSQSTPPEDTALALPSSYPQRSQLRATENQGLNPVEISGDSFEHIAGWISCGLSNHGFDGRSDIWQDFLNFNSGTQTPRAIPDETGEDIGSLGFLDTFTSTTGFVSSFDCGTIEQRRRVNAYFSEPATTSADSSGTCRDDASYYEADEDHPVGTTLSRWLSDPLSFKCHEIVTSIRNIVFHKSRRGYITVSWSPTIHETCAQFFSPTNIRRFVHLYWAIWHPNVNIVHKPTFDPTSSKAELLAAMSLIGACVSPDQADVENAKRWFNCVEEMVFDDEDFCSEPPNAISEDQCDLWWRRQKVRALQASYMVCLFQNWEGTNSSKRRIRRQRFGMVIAAARDVGIHNARHPDYDHMDLCDFSFDNFAVIEELIRVFLWVFLLDTAFVIFNNLPPRMVIREMRMNAACSEACFQAMTAEECFRTLRHQAVHQHQNDSLVRSPPVSNNFTSAFELLYRTDLDDTLSAALADLGPLNLFAMTSALHSLIFHHQSSFSCQGSLDPIHNALQSWRKLWHVYLYRFARDSHHSTVKCDMEVLAPDDMWRRVGFMRHANEYWYLANLMVQRLSMPPLTDPSESAVEASGQAQSPLSASGNESVGPLLEKYDETSMQQVNTLISDFQMFRIH
ncbi:uncharacterized protein A1O5_12334 [Cladophialophora psammophila CBS 110553]|uniref:C2H2-type domain-containing protein n=1 Tax=Cladophialophora psammophila CBS 110553 TaxID=1182543 RepID=W9VZT6_9EURO|nr:uncharacterized protein A1O5_12334 [Cladophialophora psammophila CBS 110553]EXJ57776.1 hypothetical protein A1O5_12334 [Cladophialophora psammophila CBS 110553]